MKKFIEKLKKNWIRVWLLIIAVISSTFVVIAAYTEVSSVKRVVSTAEAPGVPFSSNCMKTTITSRRMTSSVFKASVCNYDQDHPEKFSSTEITYILEAELQVKIGLQYVPMSTIYNQLQEFLQINESERTAEQVESIALYQSYVTKASNYTIRKTEDDLPNGSTDTAARYFVPAQDYKVTYGTDVDDTTYEALKAKRSSKDIFTVTIDPNDVDSAVEASAEPLFFVQLTATPKSGVVYPLSVRLYGTSERDPEEAQWEGNVTERGTDYDFYNYVITGSGKGTLDILWDENFFFVNKFFLEENEDEFRMSKTAVQSGDTLYGDSGTKGHYTGWYMVSLPVDSTLINRYEFQLYKAVEKQNISPSGHIVCYFTPEQNETPAEPEP